MHKEEGSIYSLDTINNAPSCKATRNPTFKCSMISLFTLPSCVQQSVKTSSVLGDSEPAPTNALWKMNGKRSQNNFMLGSSSLANHGG
jgi:hypothetical protein